MGFFDKLSSIFSSNTETKSSHVPTSTYKDVKPAINTPTINTSNCPILYFDLETTGLSPYNEEILQLSIIDDDGVIVYNSYFKPQKHESWPNAERVNHISPKMVKNAPSFSSQKETIQNQFNKCRAAFGYNVSFDRRFLEANGICFDNIMVSDVLRCARREFPELSDHKLITMAEHFKFDYDKHPAHNSLSDVFATKLVADNVSLSEKNAVYERIEKEKLAEQKAQERQAKKAEKEKSDAIKAKAKELYGKSSFTYKGIKYDATKNWDEFVKAIEIKEYESRPEVKAEKQKAKRAADRKQKFEAAAVLAQKYLDLTEEEYYKYYVGGYGGDIVRLCKEVFNKNIDIDDDEDDFIQGI